MSVYISVYMCALRPIPRDFYQPKKRSIKKINKGKTVLKGWIIFYAANAPPSREFIYIDTLFVHSVFIFSLVLFYTGFSCWFLNFFSAADASEENVY